MIKINDTEFNENLAATLPIELADFTGTAVYSDRCLGLHYSDGIRFLAERAKADWLIWAIALLQPRIPEGESDLLLWEFVVNDDRSARLMARRNEGEPNLVEHKIKSTDFPLKKITLLLKDGMLRLPSEH